MLVLSRKPQEKIRIGDHIVVTVLKTKGKAVRLGIEAPDEVPVLRGELVFDTSGDGDEESTGSSEAPPPTPSIRQTPHQRDHRQTPEVNVERVPRDRRTKIIPQLVRSGGPLRPMLDRRVIGRVTAR